MSNYWYDYCLWIKYCSYERIVVFLLKLIHIFSLFSYSCTTLYKISNLRNHEHCPKCSKSCKNYNDLNSNFGRKKWFFFRVKAQFRAKLVSYWYTIDAKFRAKKVISCKNTKLLRKRIYCFVETLVTNKQIKCTNPFLHQQN